MKSTLRPFGRTALALALCAALVPVPAAFAAPLPSAAKQTSRRPAVRTSARARKWAPDELIVRYVKGAGASTLSRAERSVGAASSKQLKFGRGSVRLLKLQAGTDVRVAAAKLETQPGVVYAEPNYVRRLATAPNDALYPTQWPLANTAQFPGAVAGDDIHANAAWQYMKGKPETVVAVIDTGVDYNHPDLAANMWTNTGEIPGNGIDDDGNGYVDDVHGVNVNKGTGDPMDHDGHGTHVAGTVAASADDTIGISGVAPGVRIMAVDIEADDGYIYDSDILAGIAYAETQGADVINASFGGPEYSQAESDGFGAFSGVVVTAAGNEGSSTPFYPAAYGLPNEIAVAATDYADRPASFTSYGSWVDVAAPGVAVMSTWLHTRTPGGTTVLSSDFSSGSGWSHDEQTGMDQWALGSGYITGAGQSAVIANYRAGDKSWLYRTVDLSGLSAADHPALDFDAVFAMQPLGDATGHLAVLDVVATAPDGTQVYDELDARTSRWPSRTPDHFQVDLSSLAGKSGVEIDFALQTVGAAPEPGMFIAVDNVRVGGTTDVPVYSSSYRYLQGTSQASPQVAGIAALLLSQRPYLTPAQVKQAIRASVDKRSSLTAICSSGGRVSALNALRGRTSISGTTSSWVSHDVTFTLSAAPYDSAGGLYYGLNGPAATLYSVPATVSAEGVTTVSYHCVDASGVVDPDESVTVRIDKSAPVTSLTGARLLWSGSSSTLSAVDAYSGVGSTSYSIDGGAWRNGSTFSSTVAGTHSLAFKSVDKVGNAETSENATFTVRPYERIAGADRFETAIAVARKSFPTRAPAIVIAFSHNYPDALAAAPLARAYGGPVLLTPTVSLPSAVADEIRYLAPSRVFIVGGTSVVSPGVENSLRNMPTHPLVTRIAGADRADTAARVAEVVKSKRGTPGKAIVVNGWDFRDALIAAPLAAAKGWPLLLTRPTSLPSYTSAELARLNAGSTLVVGDTNDVSTAVYNLLPRREARTLNATDHTKQSGLVFKYARQQGLAGTHIALSTGANFPDALAAGAYLAIDGGLVSLTGSSAVPSDIVAAKLSLTRLEAIGGTAVVPEATVNQAKTALQ